MRWPSLAFAALAVMAVATTPVPAGAASPAPSALPSSCPKTLKFAGSLYLDTDTTALPAEVGPMVGETEPNPARCALPDRLKVYRRNGHNSNEEVVYYVDGRTAEIFRSAGVTGFPGAGLVRWLVLVLVVGILLFAAVPAILAHLRQPPVEVGTGGRDWTDDT
jgi:hypothetical protein